MAAGGRRLWPSGCRSGGTGAAAAWRGARLGWSDLIGLILIGLSRNADTRRWLPAVAGFGLVGVAAAVQGPQLLGGGLVLGWCARRWIQEREWRTLTLSVVTFLAPTLCDNSIRTAYGVTNNAMANLYCAYTDPAHAWTPQTDQLYHLKNPSNQVVV